MSAKVKKSALIGRVVRAAEQHFGKEPGTLWPVFGGDRIDLMGTISDYEMESEDGVDLYARQVGGKPIICLYSPSDVDASVKLSLTPEWRFSAIYPVVRTKTDRGEQIEWNVRTHQDGTLTEKNTGLKVSYLFWEAE